MQDTAQTLRAKRVSLDGGAGPVWEPRGRELFFVRKDEIFAVAVAPGAPMAFGTPKPILKVSGLAVDDFSVPYDISPDGRRFVVSRRWPDPARQIQIVLGLRFPDRRDR